MQGICARSISPVVLSALLAAAGCAYRPYLVPAANIPTAPNNAKTGVAEAAGVRIEANGDAWTGQPSNLGRLITPVLVTVQNKSGKPLRIQYKDFKLTGSPGFNSVALPPFKITGSVPSAPVEVTTPGFGYDGFQLAPYYGSYYPGLGLWDGPFDDDYSFYTTYFAQWPVQLPTKEMIRRAIPEGVIAEGGRLSGFLYFSKVPQGDKSVTLAESLVDAKTGRLLGPSACLLW